MQTSTSTVPDRSGSTWTRSGDLDEQRCWRAVVERDGSADGAFYFGVVTTGVYCRPSCAAREPLRKNVRFYSSTAEAQADGLRPCKRCHPLGKAKSAAAERVAEVCGYIRRVYDSGDPLDLDTLSSRVGLSPSQLRRQFRDIVGLTPRQFVEACRFDTLKAELRRGAPVTDAIYHAGFGSPSQVYERTDAHLGMTPAAYRAGGRDLSISYALTETPVGLLLVAATDRGLCSVRFGEQREAMVEGLCTEFPNARFEETSPASSTQLTLWLDALRHHLDGTRPHLDLPLDVRATAFQHRVWRYLQTIPYGETRSYSEVAQGVGRPEAVRAVAGACAANRAAIVVPCHRVIRADGHPGGYRWGAARKKQLLEREQRRTATA